MENNFENCMKVAQNYDVATPKDCLVLYSVTGQPTKKNRDDAFAFVAEHKGAMMIEHTPCGSKLVEMGLSSSKPPLADNEIVLVWQAASRRMIEQASGNVTAFVDGAVPESVFRKTELPLILQNKKIKTINGFDKNKFAAQFGL